MKVANVGEIIFYLTTKVVIFVVGGRNTHLEYLILGSLLIGDRIVLDN